jgi:hypothetical protein
MLAMLLDASQAPESFAWSVQYHLPEQVDLPRDKEFLIEYAGRRQPQAEAVAKAIRADQEEFWPVSFQLVNMHPGDEGIKRELESRVEFRMGQVIHGPQSPHLRACAGSVDAALNYPTYRGVHGDG